MSESDSEDEEYIVFVIEAERAEGHNRDEQLERSVISEGKRGERSGDLI